MADDDPKDLSTVIYKTQPDGSLTPSQPKTVMTPQEEQEMFQLAMNDKVCGQCKYFEHAEGQARMKALRFLKTLTKEHGWQVRHLASNPEHLGLCGAADSGGGNNHTLTGALHKSCDQFRPNNGLISLRKKGVF